MNNIFRFFDTHQDQLIFLYYHFFLCMIWSWLKLILSKVKIGMIEIYTLVQKHEIKGKVSLKSDKNKFFFTRSVFQDQIAIKVFLGPIQSTRY